VKTANKKTTTKVIASKAKTKLAPVKKVAPAKPAQVKKSAPSKPAPVKKSVTSKSALVKKTAPSKALPTKKPVPAKPVSPGKGAVKASPGTKAATKTKTTTPASKPGKQSKPAVVPSKVAASKNKPKAAVPIAQKAVTVAPKSTPAPKAKVKPAPSPQKKTPVPEAKPMTVKKVATLAPPVAQAAVMAVAPVGPDQLIRSTRPSARLAQITVPSLPPAVASTAAKASFMPSAPVVTVSAPFAPIKKDPKLANNWKTKPVEGLTDAEILAMPDSEYMNKVQMAYFRRKLSILKQEILNSAGATTEHLREDTVVVPDPADRATIEEEHALELRTRDRERKLLKKIEQSIGLIDSGEYGYCDETGEPIGVGRLLARPTATLSLEAQQRRELKQIMFGD
jgi:DnaK suppressor protein